MAEALSFSVSPRPIHSLEEQLSKFPTELLDRTCADNHLVNLSQSIAEWRDVSPYLSLSPAEERGILTALPQATPARQRIDMLRTWRDKLGSKATYRCLITALHEANKVDLVDKLHLITAFIPVTHDQVERSIDLGWYGSYLKKQYLEVLFALQLSANKWLPSPTNKIFNLAIINRETIQRSKHDDDFVQKTIRGQVDDILLQKSPIQLKNIFDNIKKRIRKVILIDGAPGSGKSTLTVHICQEWSKGELFPQFSIVVLVQLRDPKVQSAQTIADLLPCENRAMAKQAAEEILAVRGRGVLWILDGWDELPSHLRDRGSFLCSLVQPQFHQENPLSETAVIVTSRPISSGDLCPLVSSRIEVLGFTTEEQRLFFTECLRNDTKAVDDLIERLNSNPAMEGSCYLPLNASIVAHLYLASGSPPLTIYGMFSSLVQHCLSRYLHERKGVSLELASMESLEELPHELRIPFNKLCELAFMGAKDNKVTFSASDVCALGVPDDVCELGLLQAIPSIISHGREVYHNFLHLSIQELLAAVYISQLPVSDQISTFDSMFNKARFSAVLQFYAAITKLRTSRPLLSLVPRFLRPTPASIYDLIRKIVRSNSKPLFVTLVNCLYEAQDASLCVYVADQLKAKISFLDKLFGRCEGDEINFWNETLLPRDCLSIGYFLAVVATTYKKDFTVHLGGCSLGDIGTKILMQSLCRSLSGCTEVTCYFEVFLHRNDITEVGALYIAEALTKTRVFWKLVLEHNPISPAGVKSIESAMIQNNIIKKVDFSSCEHDYWAKLNGRYLD